MSFFNRGLLISTSITILLCGAVMYLCHLRLARIEEAVSRQNQVMAGFLQNVQRDIVTGASAGGSLAAPSACAAAEQFLARSNGGAGAGVRITVSDTEETESEEESEDSDSESSDGSESEEEDELIPRLTVTEIAGPELQIIDASHDDVKLVHLTPKAVEVEEPVAIDVTVDESSSSSSEEEDEEEDDEPEPSPEPSPSPQPAKLKVEDLRKQAVDANLCTKEQAKKLKKPALMALIQTSQGIPVTAGDAADDDEE